MVTTVTIPQSLGGSATPYNDGTGPFGFAGSNGYGYKTYLMPMLSEFLAMCQLLATAANTAVNAPGTAGTSTTSLTIGAGAQSFATQTGKAWSVGQGVVLASTASPLNWMAGTITAYSSGTGAMVVQTVKTNGSGTFAAWTISLSAPVVDTLSVPSHNRVINAGAMVAQRPNLTFSGAGTIAYGAVDRFLLQMQATTVAATGSQGGKVNGFDAPNCVSIGGATTTGTTTVGFITRLEAKHVQDMNGKTVVFAGKIFQDTGAAINFTPTIAKASTLDNFGATTVVATGAAVSVPTSVATSFSVSVTLGAADASTGVQLSVSGSCPAVTGKTFLTADWVFDLGSVAPAPEKWNYADEYYRCCRYYYAPADTAIGLQFSTVGAIFPIRFPVPMRQTPSQVALNNSPALTVGGSTAPIAGTWTTSTLGVMGAVAQFGRTAGTWTVGDAIAMNDAARAVPSIAYNAEL